MIVRNEEANLADCLASAAGLTAEIIVVDTGSNDRTKQIASTHGARVYEFSWIDDFAAARNESIRHATGEWIFYLDADDRLDEINRERLRQLFRSLPGEKIGYLMRYSCLINPLTQKRLSVDQVRLFPNHPEIRWAHRVHEQILPSIQRLGGNTQKTDIVIRHLGYQDSATRHRKNERNLKLLLLESEEKPDTPFTLFNLGWTFYSIGRLDEAQRYLEHALELGSPKDYQAPKLFLLLAKVQRNKGRMAEALEMCRRGRHFFPEDPELLFNEALFYHQRGDFRKAAARLEGLLQIEPSTWFTFGVDDGLSGYLTRHNLAIVYRDQGRIAEAEDQWRHALAELPKFTPALLGLGELLAVQKRWTEMEEICLELDQCTGGKTDAAVLRARAHIGHEEFGQARKILEEVIEKQPRFLWPRVILARALLQEASDPVAAEKVVRGMLELDPGNNEAKRSLAKLLAQRQANP
jgi:glycosyltransferase involved in cell wall biosynthesis